jgi:hypothetical protein
MLAYTMVRSVEFYPVESEIFGLCNDIIRVRSFSETLHEPYDHQVAVI